MPASPDTDFVVIGAGIAGLRAAIELAAAGRVLVLSKQEITDFARETNAGPTDGVLSDEDEISLHLQDTLEVGDGLSNPEAAKVLVEEAPERIAELIAWATKADRGGIKLTFEGAGVHSRNRTLHANGASTGREILRTLCTRARSLPEISVRECEFSSELDVIDGRIAGVRVFDHDGQVHTIQASAVLLATGGLGQLYLNTTNPATSTGDGVALAYRGGAEIMDMEFVQFHPTALYLKKAPRLLLSEALLEKGAHLLNMEMTRFMPKYHPMGELAPHHVLARAIMHELDRSRAKDPVVYLDLTDLDAQQIRRRFPRIYAACMQCNIDIASEFIPLQPAAHFSMGGVRTNLEGQTSLPGLYAAGETAANGVHGANRLAGNSLLEALVFAARAGRKMCDTLRRPMAKASRRFSARAYSNGPLPLPVEQIIGQIRQLMWKHAGIVRTGSSLEQAIRGLEEIGRQISYPHNRRECEARNLQTAGLLIARSALAREESRGSHYRTDFPDRNDMKLRRHSLVAGDKIRFE
ncbi:MAG: L-aspartate oxidase [Acidobacteria bacterium]|nr:L-aspartate oxidase [Acidobacteriota bacterium]